ncbi:MAG: DEAD/DEAH box helicase [Acidimicrobiales bacterium]
MLVSAEAAGDIADDELTTLEAVPDRWEATLRELLDETEESLERVARSDRAERDQVLVDLRQERDRLADALRRLRGDDYVDDDDDWDEDEPEPEPAGRSAGSTGRRSSQPTASGSPRLADVPVALQVSWQDGLVVVWAGSPSTPPSSADEVQHLLDEAGAGAVDWAPHGSVRLPSGAKAAAFAAPIGAALGWLVGVGAGQLVADASPSTRWLGEVAVLATEMVAQGRMVPSVEPAPKRRTPANGAADGSGNGGRGNRGGQMAPHVVRWVPAPVDARRLRSLVGRMPGAVGALTPSMPPERLVRAALDAAVDAVCRAGAGRLVSPAAPPTARSYAEVSEAILASLDGTPFVANRQPAQQVGHELGLWAAPVRSRRRGASLIVTLHPPQADGGWLVDVTASGIEAHPIPYDEALTSASGKKAKSIEAERRRLERLLPALRRASGRRSQAIVDGDEAWDLMTTTGAVLLAAGFGVRVPAVATRRPSPRLQLTADPPTGGPRVGVRELSRVRWSVLFDDLELDADELARLTAESRPMVQLKGRWVALDRADLDAAAQVLAQHQATHQLSGAAIVRHAVGLEASAFGRPVAVAGSGWAVDLVREATTTPPAPLVEADGFTGTLRTYQAEARGWLAFLDRAGLGGCLAMDMGLGKTPTLLAHLAATRGQGPALVVAPPAVLGNWAAEAARFTPDLRVHVHHGADRAEADDVSGVVEGADLVLTTYATAVRDLEALERIDWHRVVLDEAQAIKNPASETAQQVRRIPARSRLALTGTPVENTLGDLWSILDFANPGLVGTRSAFIQQLSGAGDGRAGSGEAALRALNGLLVFRRTKSEPEIAAELPDKIDEVDHCGMTPEQIGLYQAILDDLLAEGSGGSDGDQPAARKGRVLAAITALKQVCNHPAAYLGGDEAPLAGRSGKLARLDELVDSVFAAGERMLIFTHFARWGERLADYLTDRTGVPIACYHGGLTRRTRDRMVRDFQEAPGAGALVLSITAGGTGLNLTAANHVVLYDRWWNPAVEDQARDRAWRIGQRNTVISHRLVCPGTVDERIEEVVAGKRRIADLVLPASSSLSDLGADQLRTALGLRPDQVIGVDEQPSSGSREEGRAA